MIRVNKIMTGIGEKGYFFCSTSHVHSSGSKSCIAVLRIPQNVETESLRINGALCWKLSATSAADWCKVGEPQNNGRSRVVACDTDELSYLTFQRYWKFDFSFMMQFCYSSPKGNTEWRSKRSTNPAYNYWSEWGHATQLALFIRNVTEQ